MFIRTISIIYPTRKAAQNLLFIFAIFSRNLAKQREIKENQLQPFSSTLAICCREPDTNNVTAAFSRRASNVL